MLQQIRLPEIGENIESGEVVTVMVAIGDVVTVDQETCTECGTCIKLCPMNAPQQS